jgi:hypothetical protein
MRNTSLTLKARAYLSAVSFRILFKVPVGMSPVCRGIGTSTPGLDGWAEYNITRNITCVDREKNKFFLPPLEPLLLQNYLRMPMPTETNGALIRDMQILFQPLLCPILIKGSLEEAASA